MDRGRTPFLAIEGWGSWLEDRAKFEAKILQLLEEFGIGREYPLR